MRACNGGFIFDTKGSCCFADENLWYILGYINSIVAKSYLALLCPTLDFSPGQLGRLPYVIDDVIKNDVEQLVEKCVEASKMDWNSFETSWEFKKHPLI